MSLDYRRWPKTAESAAPALHPLSSAAVLTGTDSIGSSCADWLSPSNLRFSLLSPRDESDRAEKIWGEAEIGRIIAAAPAHIVPAIILALWTGQRQGDLLRLTWSAYDGRYIRLRPSKGTRAVTIPVGKPLKDTLDAMPRLSTQILTTMRPTTKGEPERRACTSDGFRTSWADAVRRAGLAEADLTFHDLRGRAVTRLALAAATEAETATITGHSLETVRQILDKHYLSRDVRLAESAIRKLVRREKRGLQMTPKPLTLNSQLS